MKVLPAIRMALNIHILFKVMRTIVNDYMSLSIHLYHCLVDIAGPVIDCFYWGANYSIDLGARVVRK